MMCVHVCMMDRSGMVAYRRCHGRLAPCGLLWKKNEIVTRLIGEHHTAVCSIPVYDRQATVYNIQMQ